MATVLDTIVQVNITSDSRTVSRQGFGTPLVLTYHTRFPEAYRIYSSLFEMTDDLFAPTDPAYRVALSIFQQDPTVSKIVVGRLAAAPDFELELTVLSAVEGQHIKFTVVEPDGTSHDVDYPIPAAATTATVATALATTLDGYAGVVAVATGAEITISPATPGAPVVVSNMQNVISKDVTGDGGYDLALTELESLNDDWYFIHIDSQSSANINLVSAWAETRKKLFFYATAAGDELSGTGTLASGLKTAARKRTIGIWAPEEDQHADAGWVGGSGHKPPGSITWAYKTIVGVTPRALTSTQRNVLNTNNLNQYETVAGINITKPGVTASGAWIDEVHGIDALEADIKESVFSLLANSDKVPFTQSGFDLVGNAILGALKRFEGTIEQPGLITVGSSKVIMPSPASVNPADKAARILRDVFFQAQLAGAIHTVIIRGTLSNA